MNRIVPSPRPVGEIMVEPLQYPQAQPAAPAANAPQGGYANGSPAFAPPSGVNGLGGGTMTPGAAPAAPAPPQNQPQSFEQTFDQLSGSGAGGAPEPGSTGYRPEQGGQQQPGQQQHQQPAQPQQQPVPQQQPGQLPPGSTVNPPRDVVQGLRQRGWEVDESWNDDQFLTELGGLISNLQNAPSLEEVEQYKQLAPHLHEFAAKRPEFEKWLQSQGVGTQPAGTTQQGQQQGQPQQPPAYQAPPVDPFAENLVEMGEIARDAKGFYISQRMELAPYVNQLNAREAHRRKFRNEFETDPEGFIKKFVDPIVSERSKSYEQKIAELEKHLSQQSQESAAQQIQSYFNENHSRFWVKDQGGQQVYGQDGNPLMTQAGVAYATTVRSLQESIKDPLQRHQAALNLVEQVLPQGQPPQQGQLYPAQQPPQQQFPQQQYPYQQPPQQSPAQVQQQRNHNFLQRNRINQQMNGGHLPAQGYPNVLPQGNEAPEGSNSFEYLFDQMEATRS